MHIRTRCANCGCEFGHGHICRSTESVEVG